MSDPHGAWVRGVFVAAFALGVLGSLMVLFSTLPNLLRDMDQIDSYLDQLLSSGDFTAPFHLDQRGRSAKIARKLGLLTGWVQSTIQCIQDAVVPVESGTEQVLKAIQKIDEGAARRGRICRQRPLRRPLLNWTLRSGR